MITKRLEHITELVPELADKSNRDRFLFLLRDYPDLQEYVQVCFKHANKEISDFALLACEILCDMGIENNQFVARWKPNVEVPEVEYVPTGVFCTMLIAVMLHDLYIDEEHIITSLFKAREELYPLAKDRNNFSSKKIIDDVPLMQIFQSIEAQLGALTPVENCAPIDGNSPQKAVAQAIHIARNIDHWKQ